jgi:BASS family bile acid:Na+ symporter
MRVLAVLPRFLTPLALAAAALALLVPSSSLAERSDVLLAVLVLATALGISFADLTRLRDHARELAILSVVPFVALAGTAWLIGRPFAPIVRDGLLAVGLSCSEVAAVGLVALTGADATIALGVVTGSLIVAAVAGPLAIGLLSGVAVHAGSTHLLGRFALIVLAPLAVGIALRSRAAAGVRLAALDAQREGVAALAVAVLVYAALSGAQGAHHLGATLLASVAFLLASAALAELWRRRLRPLASAIPGALTIAMRDFAIAATLATQAFGPRAGALPGVYGVLMLLAGAIVAGRLARR